MDAERTAAGLTRRGVARLLGGAALALSPGLARPPGAGAFRRWCRVDPLLRIGGQDLHLWVALRAKNMRQARRLVGGPVEVVCHLPPLVPHERRDDDPGFGEGFAVAFERDPALAGDDRTTPLRIRVRVPTDGRGEHRVEVWLEALETGPVAGGRAYGWSDGWVELDLP